MLDIFLLICVPNILEWADDIKFLKYTVKLFSFKFQVIINTIWLKERLDNATDLPRFHHQLIPNEMEYERFFDEVGNIKGCLHIACASTFASASTSTSTLTLRQRLTQRMGPGPILCVYICVTINSMLKLTLTQTQTLTHTLRVNRALMSEGIYRDVRQISNSISNCWLYPITVLDLSFLRSRRHQVIFCQFPQKAASNAGITLQRKRKATLLQNELQPNFEVKSLSLQYK